MANTSPAFSDRPIPIDVKSAPRDKSVTFADVAMRLAHDGPVYAVIICVGILAIKGHASALEMIITALSSYVARSWPRAVQVGGGTLLLIMGISLSQVSCQKAPTGPQIDQGITIVDGACKLVEGVTNEGLIETICATIDEIRAIERLILSNRKDARLATGECQSLPGSTLCATKREIGQGIEAITAQRQKRFMLQEGGIVQ